MTSDNDKINGAVNEIVKNLRDYSTRTTVDISPLAESDRSRGDDLKVTVSYAFPVPISFKLPFVVSSNFFDKETMIIKNVAVARMEYE